MIMIKKNLLVLLLILCVIVTWCTVKDTGMQISTWSDSTGTLVFENSGSVQDTAIAQPDNSIVKVRLYQIVADPDNYTWVKISIWCEDSMWYFDAETDIDESEKYTKLFDLIKRYDNEDGWYINFRKSQDMVEFYSYELINNDRELNVYLSGTITLGGVCDTPRIIETMKYTYKWFWFDDVHIYLNNKPIEQALWWKWE